MRILSLTNLFPSPYLPHKAPFNEYQFRLLGERHPVSIIVPIAWTDEFRARRRGLPRLPHGRRIDHDGLAVDHPRFYFPPKFSSRTYGPLFEMSVRRAVPSAGGRVPPGPGVRHVGLPRRVGGRPAGPARRPPGRHSGARVGRVAADQTSRATATDFRCPPRSRRGGRGQPRPGRPGDRRRRGPGQGPGDLRRSRSGKVLPRPAARCPACGSASPRTATRSCCSSADYCR